MEEQGFARSALVTGVESPFGQALASALGRQGLAVTLCSTSPAQATSCSRELVRSGGRAVASLSPITTQEGARRAVALAVETFGGLDLLITCPELGRQRPILRIEEQTERALLDSHLASTFFCCQAAAQAMGARGGRMICLTGTAGLTTPDFGQVHHASVVGGVFAMVRALAAELRHRSVTVNAVAVPSAGLSSSDGESPEAATAQTSVLPLVAFLSSEAGSLITGQVVLVSGPKLSLLKTTSSAGAILTDSDWTAEQIGRRWSEISR